MEPPAAQIEFGLLVYPSIPSIGVSKGIWFYQDSREHTHTEDGGEDAGIQQQTASEVGGRDEHGVREEGKLSVGNQQQ